jgi:hypothetical protein
MKTVISASRRTDIPAFYLNWFIKQIRQGFVEVQNPLYKKQTHRVSLHPDEVGWIVFWSRNYAHFLKHRNSFEAFRLFFHFTILSTHQLLEKNNPEQKKSIAQMTQLVKLYSAEQIIWRYDPIVVWSKGGEIQSNFNGKNFRFLCKEFKALGINRCYFSLVSAYRKFKNRLAAKYSDLVLIPETHPYTQQILKEMTTISSAFGIGLHACCNQVLVGQTISKGQCISGSTLNRISAKKEVSEAKAATRLFCGCTRSIDIGSYNQQPCAYGCIYCYANPIWK